MKWLIFLLLLTACSRRGSTLVQLEDILFSMVEILRLPTLQFLIVVACFGLMMYLIVKYGLEKAMGESSLANGLSGLAGILMAVWIFFSTRDVGAQAALGDFFGGGFGLLLFGCGAVFMVYVIKKGVDNALFGGTP